LASFTDSDETTYVAVVKSVQFDGPR
jgi:hypothetical protein